MLRLCKRYGTIHKVPKVRNLDLLNVKGCENYLQNFAVSGLFLLGLDSKSYKIQQIYILFCTSDKCLCTKVQFYHDKIWTRIFQVAPVGQDFHF